MLGLIGDGMEHSRTTGMCTLAFPQALGTGIVVQVQLRMTDSAESDNQHAKTTSQMTDSAESDNHTSKTTSQMTDSAESDMREAVAALLRTYEHTLSRFREDSLVAAMRRATHGGSFDFPDWAGGLFDLYDALHEASDGAIDPCVGEDLTRLGYGPAYTFAAQPNARAYTGAVHGRATWHGSVERHGCTLITRGPVSLDFGACGKGYAVDLIAALLRDGGCNDERNDERNTERNADHYAGPNANRAADRALVIDAGGDLLVHLAQSPDQPVPLRVALEHPSDSTQAVGVAEIMDGALCASAPSRRHWGEQSGMRLHHLLNAIDGMPADSVAAAWAYVPQQAAFPCATADGLATALFVTPPDRLRARFRFECAFIDADGMLHASRDFPATLFLS
ncbi:thiamine biosynthesis protein ApbE [Bifidobacterium angulatum]|nr:FAD:protein FMN transferase [Bifidobacterium angulatum]AMK57250.1 thiamine biosynthesis protein ApbE [Bifidobacterium angulatum]